MRTRRQFLKEASFWAGAVGLQGSFLEAIQRASAIEPEAGSSYLDAEHVVILMQENRSFDHLYGALRGVRGFNDPRAIQLSDGNPVWVQKDAAGNRYIPFRLPLKESKSTWMGCLPHSWSDQVDAAHGGLHDRWLQVKRSGVAKYAEMPLTMGYHTREDLPFYYALADAFTVCDQNFCSSLTGTTPNRLHLWTGTIRSKAVPDSPALVRNSDCDYGNWASWKTFPEVLEDHAIAWKIYQNELTVPTDLSGEAESWVSNFGDNPIEWFSQFNVRYHPRHREFLERKISAVTREIEKASKDLASLLGDAAAVLQNGLTRLKSSLQRFQKDLMDFTPENFQKLSPYEKSLHARAFSTNAGDPFYRDLTEIFYKIEGRTQRVHVPRGDVLFQFRKDVSAGTLPTVSWIVPPERFSDHPCSPWYGQWYLSEVLNILTSNPQVWKKTVFILTYDENDGYYDHIPPFQAPHPQHRESGQASKGIDTTLDFVELEQDRNHQPKGAVRGNSIGLGFRVPMVIASPWSRGGTVCSQVFDHTSVLRFLEKFLSHKTGNPIQEENTTAWRRAICGDLTSAFQSAGDASPGLQEFLERDKAIEEIDRARFQKLPDGFAALTEEQVKQIRNDPRDSLLPRQEPGVRRSSPLPYQLAVDGAIHQDRSSFVVRMSAGKTRFGERSAGAPFIVYAQTQNGLLVRHYAVGAGEIIEDVFALNDFEQGKYQIRVHGPNGFFREFTGESSDHPFEINLEEVISSSPSSSGIIVQVKLPDSSPKATIEVRDNSYGKSTLHGELAAGELRRFIIDTTDSAGWYDVSVMVAESKHFSKCYAGRVETGQWSTSDPAMGLAGERSGNL